MFVDTNVLVAARFVTAPAHGMARACLQRASEDRGATICISRQVIREYLATVTRPQSWSKPLAMAEALGDVSRLGKSFAVLEDGPQVMDILFSLCRDVQFAGRQVHDANIVATMLAHDERRLLTFNQRDFRRYGGQIDLVSVEMNP